MFERPGGHLTAALSSEMVCLHGRPNVQLLDPGGTGYAYEKVHGLVYDPFVRQVGWFACFTFVCLRRHHNFAREAV